MENEKINYLLKEYTYLPEHKTKREYYDYMKRIDTNLVSIKAKEIVTESEKERLLGHWVEHFELDTIKTELKIVSNPKAHTIDPLLKYINEPTRFEFLTAIALKKAFPRLQVVPNYKADDEGLPTCFAPGGGADITCFDDKGNILFEVTLLTGVQQNIREMPAIARHLRECTAVAPDSFSIMICPRVHDDTQRYARFIKHDENLDVVVLDTVAFADTLGVYTSAREYRSLPNPPQF